MTDRLLALPTCALCGCVLGITGVCSECNEWPCDNCEHEREEHNGDSCSVHNCQCKGWVQSW